MSARKTYPRSIVHAAEKVAMYYSIVLCGATHCIVHTKSRVMTIMGSKIIVYVLSNISLHLVARTNYTISQQFNLKTYRRTYKHPHKAHQGEFIYHSSYTKRDRFYSSTHPN